MGSVNFLIIRDEFNFLKIDEQNEEIGNLIMLIGGIDISRSRRETEKEFRKRMFAEALNELSSDDSEYEKKFFRDRIVPALIGYFDVCSSGTQDRQLNKLAEFVDSKSKAYFDIRNSSTKGRAFKSWLNGISTSSGYKMLKFVRKLGEDNESDEDSVEENSMPSQESDSEDSYVSAPKPDQGSASGTHDSVSEGSLVSPRKPHQGSSSGTHKSDSEGSLVSPRKPHQGNSGWKNDSDSEGSLVSPRKPHQGNSRRRHDYASKGSLVSSSKPNKGNSRGRHSSDSKENFVLSDKHIDDTKPIKKGERSGASKKDYSRRNYASSSKRRDTEPVDEAEWSGASKKDKLKLGTKQKGYSRRSYESGSKDEA